jgi:hypothetical protein
MDAAAAAALREAARADLVATSLRDAMVLCLEVARTEPTEGLKGSIAISAA